MSVSALTTAMAVAAAAVPNEGPAPVAEFAFEPVSVDNDAPQVGPAASSETALPPVQSTAPSQLDEREQPTELAELTEAAQSTDPASSAQPQPQPQPQAPAPAGGPTDVIVTGRKPVPEDPLAELNSESFKVAQSVDESIVAPVAFAYEDIMPRPVRKGLSNFLHNLGEPIVFLNYLLQLKPGKAAETFGRFAINTTLGAAGLVDIAKRKPFNLPYRHNGFANTLGYYCVKPGPYFYLPLVGPTTLRDFVGDRLVLFVLPTIVGSNFRDPKIVTPIWVLKELGRRIEIDDELRETQATRDPYVTARTHYLQKRQAEIDALHGRKPPVPTPTSSGPAPTLTPPAQLNASPQDQIPADKSQGKRSPVVSDLGSSSQWLAAPGLAYTF